MHDAEPRLVAGWMGPAELAVAGLLLLGVLALLFTTFVPSADVRHATDELESWHAAAEALAAADDEQPTWTHYDATRPALFAPETDAEGHVPLADIDVEPTAPGEVGLLAVADEDDVNLRRWDALAYVHNWELVAAIDDDLARATGTVELTAPYRGSLASSLIGRIDRLEDADMAAGRDIIQWETRGGGPYEVTITMSHELGPSLARTFPLPSTTCIDRQCRLVLDPVDFDLVPDPERPIKAMVEVRDGDGSYTAMSIPLPRES